MSTEAKEKAAAAVAALGLTIAAAFVPFSQSRNHAEKDKSLNWRVTLHCDGRLVLATDYSAGIGHCPGYKPRADDRAGGYERRLRTDYECERGTNWHQFGIKGRAILPDPLDVVYSLVRDADVLEYSTFEGWASEFGYDPDSRKGEAIYRQCLELALKLRGTIGEHGLAQLREAFHDY